MKETKTYEDFLSKEERITNELLNNYLKNKENMKLVNKDFEDTTLGELPTEEIIDDIKTVNDYLIQKTTSSEKYTKTWLYIYEDEILRRRIQKINKIKLKI